MLNLEQINLINSNIKLVNYVINKLHITHDYEDILQEGYLALCKAALRYNKNKGKFSTYAYNYIKNSILQYINYNSVIKPKRKGNKIEKINSEEYDDNCQYTNKTLTEINLVEFNIDYKDFFNTLTEEEKFILDKKQQRYKIVEIAKMLDRSEKTIYSRLNSIKQKFMIFKENN
jgi:RNA polymerase sigma factor (sigma-70 family)